MSGLPDIGIIMRKSGEPDLRRRDGWGLIDRAVRPPPAAHSISGLPEIGTIDADVGQATTCDAATSP
jgi:hypothetical protein